ncbi:MAG: hypothetical protein AABP62_27450, partial [Planctomycetota bacterium]
MWFSRSRRSIFHRVVAAVCQYWKRAHRERRLTRVRSRRERRPFDLRGQLVQVIERLEDRALLAAVSDGGGTTLTIELAANEDLAVVSNGATYTFSSDMNFTDGGVANAAADFSVFGGTSLTLQASGLTQYSTVSIIDVGTNSTVTFNPSGANTLSDIFSVVLDDAGAGAIVFNGATAFTGTNSLSVSTSKNILLNSGSSVMTVNGGITLSANAAGTTAGNFRGLDANNATIQTIGTGDIVLQGRGGNDVATGLHYGVYLQNGTSVSSTALGATAGEITITGTGGAGTIANIGAYLSGTTTDVTSIDGAISITGTGGNGSTNSNFGVYLSDIETVSSTGTGASAAPITITGTGGTGVSFNFGVDLLGVTTDVTSVDGAISISGTGGNGSGASNNGVNLDFDAAVQVTTGLLTVSGTASAGNSAGVRLTEIEGGQLKSVGMGGIVVTADGNGTSADMIAGSDSILGGVTATGAIAINADSIDLLGTTSVQTT